LNGFDKKILSLAGKKIGKLICQAYSEEHIGQKDLK